MANYYTEFSLNISNLTADERTWLEGLLNDVGEPAGYLAEILGEPEWLGFEFEFEDNDSLWIHSGESGTVENVAGVVQAFLAQFRPNETFGFEWANTCSKPRVDAFGGGAVFITATEQRWMASGNWLAEQEPTMTTGRVEIIHGRDPDLGCDLSVYVDGEVVSPDVYDVDPGRGYLRSDWDESTDADCAAASPAAAAELRKLRDDIARTSTYIEP